MTTPVNLAAQLLNVFDTIPMSNRNYCIDPNIDQYIAGSVTMTSAAPASRGLTPMYNLNSGTGGGATATGVGPGVIATNEQPGMYSPAGGSIAMALNGASTGTVAARTAPYIVQNLENVQTLNGRSSTFSLWLWTASGTANITSLFVAQYFGSGGSTSVIIDTPVNWTVTTTPQRFSARVDWPSVAGKIAGTGLDSCIQIGLFLPSGVVTNIGTRQWQLEQSSPFAPVAGLPTAFEYRGQAAEFIRVQRYYETGSEPQLWLPSFPTGDSSAYGEVRFQTNKRSTAAITYNAWGYYNASNSAAFTPTTINSNNDRFGFIGTGLTNWNGWSGIGTWIADSRL